MGASQLSFEPSRQQMALLRRLWDIIQRTTLEKERQRKYEKWGERSESSEMEITTSGL